MLIAVYPGPKAPDNEEVQYVLVPFIDDLIRLFEDGIWIKTYEYPEGELFNVYSRGEMRSTDNLYQ